MTDSFKIINRIIDKWNNKYTQELRKHIYNFHCQEEWKKSDDMAHWLMWGYLDMVCFYQGLIYAKSIWNYDMFESKCIECPYRNSECRFMRVLK